MRLHEIHVDGFGIHHDRRVGPFAPGLNVLVGPNEAGKSTLRDFIRALFVGFETRRRDHHQRREPLAGGCHGGWATIEDDDGTRVRLTLTEGRTRRGERHVETEAGHPVSPEWLDAVVGDVTPAYVEHVHAFGLRELSDAKALTGRELEDYLFGASAGMDPRRLDRVRKTLESRVKALFRPRSGGRLNDLVDELHRVRAERRRLDAQAASVSAWEEEHLATRGRIGEIDAQLESRRAELESCRQLVSIEPDWRRYRELDAARARHASAGDAELPDPEVERVAAALVEARAEARSRLAAAEAELARATAERDAIVVRTPLLAARADRARLTGLRDAVVRDRTRALAVEDEIRQATSALEARRRALAPVLGDRDAVLTSERAREACRSLNARAAATDMGRLGRRRRRTRAALIGIAVAMLGGAIVAALVGHVATVLSVVLALILAVGAGSWIADWWRSRRGDTDWRAALATFGLAESLTPGEAGEVLREILAIESAAEAMSERVDERARLERSLAHAAERVGTWCRDHDAVGCRVAHAGSDEIDVVATVDAIVDAMRDAGAAEAARDEAERRVSARAQDLETVRRRLDHADGELGELWASFGCDSDEAFQRCLAAARDERASRTERLALARRLGDTVVDAPDDADPAGGRVAVRAVTELAEIDFAAARERVAALTSETLELTAALDAARVTLGELAGRIAAVRESDRASELRQRDAQLVAEVDRVAADWAIHRAAAVLLDEAAERFQERHQPAVMRTASTYFRRLTEGAFDRVLRPVEPGATRFICERANGDRLAPEALSRGTREQLYLALRLAVIRESVATRPALPVVMDDVLVNFDPARLERALEVISDVAATHQILYFTCHESLLDATCFSREPPTVIRV